MRTLLVASGAATLLLAMALATSVTLAARGAWPASALGPKRPAPPVPRLPSESRPRPQLTVPSAAPSAPVLADVNDDGVRHCQLSVIDADTRVPIAGAQLIVDRAGAHDAVATTDSSGHLSYGDDSLDPLAHAWIAAPHRPVRPLSADELADAAGGETTVEVPSFAHLRVRVWPPVGEDRRPWVDLSFRTADQRDAHYQPSDSLSLAPESDGEWTTASVAPGTVHVVAIVESQVIASGTVEVGSGQTREVTLQRQPPSSARIRVVDAAGRPVAGVSVRAESPVPTPTPNAGELSPYAAWTSTDKRGLATVPASAELPMRATLTLDGDDVAHLDLTSGGERTVVVDRPIVTCTLESPAGEPLPITGYSKSFQYQGGDSHGLGMFGSGGGGSGADNLRVVWELSPTESGQPALAEVTISLHSGAVHGTATLTRPDQPCRIVAEPSA